MDIDIGKILGLCDAGNFKYKHCKKFCWLQIVLKSASFLNMALLFVFQNYMEYICNSGKSMGCGIR